MPSDDLFWPGVLAGAVVRGLSVVSVVCWHAVVG